MTENVGRNIAAARKKAGLSQSDLAERVCRTRECISNYESGRREVKAGFLDRLAKALHVKPAALVEDVESSTQSSN